MQLGRKMCILSGLPQGALAHRAANIMFSYVFPFYWSGEFYSLLSHLKIWENGRRRVYVKMREKGRVCVVHTRVRPKPKLCIPKVFLTLLTFERKLWCLVCVSMCPCVRVSVCPCPFVCLENGGKLVSVWGQSRALLLYCRRLPCRLLCAWGATDRVRSCFPVF